MTDYRTEKHEEIATHSEQPACSPLTVVDLAAEAGSVHQVYKNFVLLNVNNHCVRMAVMQGEYRWHQHPNSDECFLVMEGELEIDLKHGKSFRLKPGEALTIPKGTVHRTRSGARSVNLCFEEKRAYTEAVFEDDHS